ncbi:MAG TPA: hypothetical protein VF176_04780 [Solirubrobacterales bacterium]
MPAYPPTTLSLRTAIARTASLVIGALALAALAAPSAGATPAGFAGASGDGSIAFFTTTEQLVVGDTDNRTDVFARFYDGTLGQYVTREISTGPTGGNDALSALYDGASGDGAKAAFSTAESLVAADTDHSVDVYVRDLGANTTSLVSAGDSGCAPGCGNGASDANVVPGGVVADGTAVFFVSSERLAPSDGDDSLDVYVRDLVANTTSLVSAGDSSCAPGCGNGAFPAVFRDAPTATKALFTTNESLVAADTDNLSDIYQRDLTSGTTALVSTSGVCPIGLDCSPAYGDASGDGQHILFETGERLVVGDTDSSQDVYDWSAGVATLVSTGPTGGNGAQAATFSGTSSNGGSVYFETSESLVVADTDSSKDVYERSGGVTALVSTGPAGGSDGTPASFRWVSPDGSGAAVMFSTSESLVVADTDGSQDVYERSGGVTTLLSTGPAGGNGNEDASFAGASNDGSHVLFITAEKLVSQDIDSSPDIYDAAAGTTTLVSTGPLGGNGAFSPGLPLGGVAGDGSHVFFVTDERLAVDDLDAEADIYDRFASGTLLVSVGNAAPVGPPTPSQLSTDPASPGESTTPAIKGQSDPNTSIKIYTTSNCSGVPLATGTAAQLGGSGILVSVASGSTTSFRATATDSNGDTSPCSAAVSYTQQDATPPPPPPPPPDPDPGTGGGDSGASGGSGGTSTGTKKGSGGGAGAFHVTPHTRITFAPAGKTRARRPVFRFTDSTGQEGTSFICKLDRNRWRSCGSPSRLKPLPQGRHVFKVKGVNALGVWEPKPVQRSFRLVTG